MTGIRRLVAQLEYGVQGCISRLKVAFNVKRRGSLITSYGIKSTGVTFRWQEIGKVIFDAEKITDSVGVFELREPTGWNAPFHLLGLPDLPREDGFRGWPSQGEGWSSRGFLPGAFRPAQLDQKF